jgi:hypothetical protein
MAGGILLSRRQSIQRLEMVSKGISAADPQVGSFDLRCAMSPETGGVLN